MAGHTPWREIKHKRRERWINVVVEVTKATDLTLEATAEQREQALAEMMDRCSRNDPEVVCSGRLEVVEDGETVEVLKLHN